MEVVGWHLGVPASEVYGAATSYSELRTAQPSTHLLRVCTGLGCRIVGALDMLAAAEVELGVAAGGSTSDGVVTLEETPCGFLCGMAPAIEIDGQWRGRAGTDALRDIVREWRR